MLILAILGLFLPGYYLARVCGMPRPRTAAFPLSALLVCEVVIAYSIAGVPLRFSFVLAALGILTAACAIASRRTKAYPADAVAANGEESIAAVRLLGTGTIVIVSVVLMAVFMRTSLYPLSGFDTVFRWDALARAMLDRESLDFYPPVEDTDFQHYVFPDSLPPLVSSVYWWLYASCGQPMPAVTALAVVLQLVSTLALTFFAARELFGVIGGCFALLAAATSTLLIRSFAIGQETGYTALCVAGQLYFTQVAVRRPAAASVVIAALFAALGALAREYGPALAVSGGAVLASNVSTRRYLPLFAAVVVVAAGPWYVRSWALTGNPVYSLNLAGAFPLNAVHAGIVESYPESLGLHTLSASKWLVLSMRLLLGAPLAILLGLPAGIVCWRTLAPLLITAAMAILLWFWSVGYTAGGIDYSLRVLAPAWVALSVCAGAVGRRWLALVERGGALPKVAMTLTMAICGIYAAVFALSHPFEARDVVAAVRRERSDPLESWVKQLQIADILEKSDLPTCGVLTDDCFLAIALQRTSRFHPVMVWSPDVAFVFDPSIESKEAQRRLRERNILLVSATSDSPNNHYLMRFPLYREDNSHWTQVAIVETMAVFYLSSGEPAGD